MIKKSLCKSLLILLLWPGSLFCAQAHWFLLDPDRFSSGFRDVVLDNIRSRGQFDVRSETVALGAIKDRLTPPPNGTLFVQCTLEDYEKLLKDPETKALLSALHLEVLNPRLLSFPFYILEENEHATQASPVQIAVLSLQAGDLYEIQEADLLTFFSQLLGKPKNAIKILKERQAYTAAKGLFDGTYHLTGIYEDEPSVLLDEFQINLAQELKAKPARFVNFTPRDTGQIYEAVPGRLRYVFFSQEGQTSVAIVQEMQHRFPVILSNISSLQKEDQEGFQKALSDAYLMILPEAENSATGEKERRMIQRMYLLNAYLNDSDNHWKGLALLGQLILLRDSKQVDPQKKLIYAEKCELLQKEWNLPHITADLLLQWLGIEATKIEKRELFTDDVSRMYENALRKIDEGLRGNGESRRKKWEEARRDLIAALLQGDQPREIKGSRGLWSTPDYNPYYQLARVSLYLETMSRVSQ